MYMYLDCAQNNAWLPVAIFEGYSFNVCTFAAVVNHVAYVLSVSCINSKSFGKKDISLRSRFILMSMSQAKKKQAQKTCQTTGQRE